MTYLLPILIIAAALFLIFIGLTFLYGIAADREEEAEWLLRYGSPHPRLEKRS